MAKTWEQILDEVGKVPPEQSMRDENELRAEMGTAAFMKEYYRVALKRSKARFTQPTHRLEE